MRRVQVGTRFGQWVGGGTSPSAQSGGAPCEDARVAGDPFPSGAGDGRVRRLAASRPTVPDSS